MVYDMFPQLATAAICLSSMLSFYLYRRSFSSGVQLALEGNTGSPIYDFFKGRELNPRLSNNFDLKFFCELRCVCVRARACSGMRSEKCFCTHVLANPLSLSNTIWQCLHADPV